MHLFFGVERSETEKNRCGAARGQAADVSFAAHSLYETGAIPPGFTDVILILL